MASRDQITFNGFTGTRSEVATHFGINVRTLTSRLNSGWSLSKALTTPVDKSHSCKKGIVHSVGAYKGFPDDVGKHFGILLDSRERIDTALIVNKIRKRSNPVFYSVGPSYKGTLKAIAYDFNCPLSLLKSGVSSGLSPEEVLFQNGISVNTFE